MSLITKQHKIDSAREDPSVHKSDASYEQESQAPSQARGVGDRDAMKHGDDTSLDRGGLSAVPGPGQPGQQSSGPKGVPLLDMSADKESGHVMKWHTDDQSPRQGISNIPLKHNDYFGAQMAQVGRERSKQESERDQPQQKEAESEYKQRRGPDAREEARDVDAAPLVSNYDRPSGSPALPQRLGGLDRPTQGSGLSDQVPFTRAPSHDRKPSVTIHLDPEESKTGADSSKQPEGDNSSSDQQRDATKQTEGKDRVSDRDRRPDEQTSDKDREASEKDSSSDKTSDKPERQLTGKRDELSAEKREKSPAPSDTANTKETDKSKDKDSDRSKSPKEDDSKKPEAGSVERQGSGQWKKVGDEKTTSHPPRAPLDSTPGMSNTTVRPTTPRRDGPEGQQGHSERHDFARVFVPDPYKQQQSMEAYRKQLGNKLQTAAAAVAKNEQEEVEKAKHPDKGKDASKDKDKSPKKGDDKAKEKDSGKDADKEKEKEKEDKEKEKEKEKDKERDKPKDEADKSSKSENEQSRKPVSEDSSKGASQTDIDYNDQPDKSQDAARYKRDLSPRQDLPSSSQPSYQRESSQGSRDTSSYQADLSKDQLDSKTRNEQLTSGQQAAQNFMQQQQVAAAAEFGRPPLKRQATVQEGITSQHRDASGSSSDYTRPEGRDLGGGWQKVEGMETKQSPELSSSRRALGQDADSAARPERLKLPPLDEADFTEDANWRMSGTKAERQVSDPDTNDPEGSGRSSERRDQDVEAQRAEMRKESLGAKQLKKQPIPPGGFSKRDTIELVRALRNNDDQTAMALLQRGTTDLNCHTPKGETPLTVAVLAGNDALVAALLRYGADPNLENDNKDTPLLLAAGCGDAQMVRALIDGGADTSVLGPGKQSALLLACMAPDSSPEVIDILLEIARGNAQGGPGSDPYSSLYEPGRDGALPLLAALADENKLAAIDLLHARGMMINGRDREDMTPLHYAAQAGALNACQVLLAFGALPNTRNKLGQTPLHLAKDQRVALCLIAHGARPKLTDYTNKMDGFANFEKQGSKDAIRKGFSEAREVWKKRGPVKGDGKTCSKQDENYVHKAQSPVCLLCDAEFGTVMNRKKNCLRCGIIVCGDCCTKQFMHTDGKPMPCCDSCYNVLANMSEQSKDLTQKFSKSGKTKMENSDLAAVAQPPSPVVNAMRKQGSEPYEGADGSGPKLEQIEQEKEKESGMQDKMGGSSEKEKEKRGERDKETDDKEESSKEKDNQDVDADTAKETDDSKSMGDKMKEKMNMDPDKSMKENMKDKTGMNDDKQSKDSDSSRDKETNPPLMAPDSSSALLPSAEQGATGAPWGANMMTSDRNETGKSLMDKMKAKMAKAESYKEKKKSSGQRDEKDQSSDTSSDKEPSSDKDSSDDRSMGDKVKEKMNMDPDKSMKDNMTDKMGINDDKPHDVSTGPSSSPSDQSSSSNQQSSRRYASQSEINTADPSIQDEMRKSRQVREETDVQRERAKAQGIQTDADLGMSHREKEKERAEQHERVMQSDSEKRKEQDRSKAGQDPIEQQTALSSSDASTAYEHSDRPHSGSEQSTSGLYVGNIKDEKSETEYERMRREGLRRDDRSQRDRDSDKRVDKMQDNQPRSDRDGSDERSQDKKQQKRDGDEKLNEYGSMQQSGGVTGSKAWEKEQDTHIPAEEAHSTEPIKAVPWIMPVGLPVGMSTGPTYTDQQYDKDREQLRQIKEAKEEAPASGSHASELFTRSMSKALSPEPKDERDKVDSKTVLESLPPTLGVTAKDRATVASIGQHREVTQPPQNEQEKERRLRDVDRELSQQVSTLRQQPLPSSASSALDDHPVSDTKDRSTADKDRQVQQGDQRSSLQQSQGISKTRDDSSVTQPKPLNQSQMQLPYAAASTPMQTRRLDPALRDDKPKNASGSPLISMRQLVPPLLITRPRSSSSSSSLDQVDDSITRSPISAASPPTASGISPDSATVAKPPSLERAPSTFKPALPPLGGPSPSLSQQSASAPVSRSNSPMPDEPHGRPGRPVVHLDEQLTKELGQGGVHSDTWSSVPSSTPMPARRLGMTTLQRAESEGPGRLEERLLSPRSRLQRAMSLNAARSAFPPTRRLSRVQPDGKVKDDFHHWSSRFSVEPLNKDVEVPGTRFSVRNVLPDEEQEKRDRERAQLIERKDYERSPNAHTGPLASPSRSLASAPFPATIHAPASIPAPLKEDTPDAAPAAGHASTVIPGINDLKSTLGNIQQTTRDLKQSLRQTDEKLGVVSTTTEPAVAKPQSGPAQHP